MERRLILEVEWPDRMTREQAVALEGGKRSLTRQVRERGLQALLVGRDGSGRETRAGRKRGKKKRSSCLERAVHVFSSSPANLNSDIQPHCSTLPK